MNGIVAILESFRGTDPTPQEVGAAADRIAGVGDAVVAPLLDALGEEDEAVLAVAAASLRRLATPAVTQHLLTLLRSPGVGDLAKALVLGILEDAGMDIHDPSLVGAVADLEGLIASASSQPPGASDGPEGPGGAKGNGGGGGAPGGSA